MRLLQRNRVPALGMACLATCLLCGCKKKLDTLDGPRPQFVLDREIRQGAHVTIPVTIDNQEFTFILDTGSELTIIDKRLRHLFGVTARQGIPLSTAHEDHDILIDAVEPAKSFSIGDKIVLDVHVGVCDLSQLRASAYDGIIGMDVLKRFAMLLDFQNNRIELATDLDLLTHGEYICSIDLLPIANGHVRPSVTMRLGDVSEDFLVDTGWPGGSAIRNDAYDIMSRTNKPQTVMLGRVDGPPGDRREAEAIYVDEVFLGNLRYSPSPFLRGRYSLIGLQFLGQHKRVVLDFIGWRIHLAP